MEKDRLFTLKWNNSRLNIKPDERYKHRECRGVHFSNGIIALSNAAVFTTKSELLYHIEKTGRGHIEYDDEQTDEAVVKHEQAI